MSNTRDTGFLRNAIQVTDQGVTFVSGSTTLMSISSSGAVTTTGVISGSNALSASFSLNSALLNGIGSVGFATTGALLEVSSSQQQISSSQQQISASLLNVVANYATTGSNSFRANQSITGSLVVSSTITAQTLVVQTVTSSIVYSSGSNIFGSALGDRQTFTGSLQVTGSGNHYIMGGNLGLGVTPSAWGTVFTKSAFQFGGSVGVGALWTNSFNNGVFLGNNLYDDGAGNARYIINGASSQYVQASGDHYWASAASGTAGNVATFTELMRITSSGSVGIGTTNPGTQLEIFSTTGATLRLKRNETSLTDNQIIGTTEFYTNDGDGPHVAAYIRGLGADLTGQNYGRFGALSFGVSKVANTDAVEAMRIDLYGNVGIGITTPSASLDVNGTGRFTSPLTINGLSPITASGGTITTPADGFKYHTFTSSGTFTVTAGLNTIEVAVVAGGGAGGGDASGATFYSGGGGAGGVVYHPSYLVTSGSYTVTVGAGGTPNAASNGWGGNGANSVFGNITAIGGGGGARGNGDNTSPVYTGLSGGSGGGGGSNGGVGGSPLTPLGSGTSYGGRGFNSSGIGGGGGGATSAGGTVAGPGGNGIHLFTTGSKYAGGGGAGVFSGNPTANAGTDGGGNGGYWNGSDSSNSSGLPGTANRGGGGGGIGYNLGTGGAGGSGIVIVRYKA